MMKVLKQFRASFSLLNPDEARGRSERPVHIGLVAASETGYAEMEEFLAPESASREAGAEIARRVHRSGDPGVPAKVDLVLYEQGIPLPPDAYTFFPSDPQATAVEILREHDDLALSLARHFPGFRKTVVDRTIQSISRENAFFAVATALPDVIPSLIELPWAFGEFASDIAFLTGNQIRMAFLLAAACGAEVGYAYQRAEILSIGAGAFGWRALARELVGKIPLGGGLIPKGAIAYAGTYVVGKSLERYYRARTPYTREERREIYREGLERGRTVAGSMKAHEIPR